MASAPALLTAQRGYAAAVNHQSNAKAAEAVVQQICGAGRRAIAVLADVANEARVLRVFTQVDEQLGLLDALMNHAGWWTAPDALRT